MSFEPANILVTGGAGFIGANFVRHIAARPGTARIVVLDALTYAGNINSLASVNADPRFVFAHGDICNEDLVSLLLAEHDIDTIVHFAAESHVDRSILGPDEFIRTNVLGTHALLKAARSFWLGRERPRPHRFHHISTDEVYGSLAPGGTPFSEQTPYAPNSPYSASKAASDHLVRAYHETYGLSVITTNCSNNYGPFQFPEKLVPLVIVNVLSGRPIPVYGDGLQIRDWLHVADHCAGIELALTRGTHGAVYNLGGGSETTNITLVEAICRHLDSLLGTDTPLHDAFPDSPAAHGRPSASLITHVSDRPGHDRRYSVDYGRARRELGYAPAHDIEAGLLQTIRWYLNHMDWWRPLLGAEYAQWVARNYGSRDDSRKPSQVTRPA